MTNEESGYGPITSCAHALDISLDIKAINVVYLVLASCMSFIFLGYFIVSRMSFCFPSNTES
jgi:hypothetical protein